MTGLIVLPLAQALHAADRDKPAGGKKVAGESTKTNSGNTKEAISALTFDGSNMTFTATSNGCTRPAHFNITYEPTGNECQITIVREQPDYCRRVPIPVEISLPWARPLQCQEKTLTVGNPLLETGSAKQPKELKKP